MVLQVSDVESTTEPESAVREIPPADVANIIEMLAAGDMRSAIRLSSRLANVSEEEAVELLAALPLFSKRAVLRLAPFNLGGGIISGLIQVGILAGAYALIDYDLILAALVFGLGLLCLRRYLRHLLSNAVQTWGTRGVARIDRRVIIGTDDKRGGNHVLVGMTIHPDGSGKPFYDEEHLFVAKASMWKLQVGNRIPVRFNRRRSLVFPTSPIAVIGQD